MKHDEKVTSVAFSPDGNHLLTGSRDGMARVWPVDGTGEPIVLAGSLATFRNSSTSRTKMRR